MRLQGGAIDLKERFQPALRLGLLNSAELSRRRKQAASTSRARQPLQSTDSPRVDDELSRRLSTPTRCELGLTL